MAENVKPADTVADEAVTRPAQVRRNRIKEILRKVTLSGGYQTGFGGLGGITKLLHFQYKSIDPSIQRELDSQLLHK